MAVYPTGAIHRPVDNFVYDTGTMSWVMETQPTGGGGGGASTIADGADVAEGATTDAAVITDATGTVSGKLRGLVKWAFERMPASLGQTTMAASLPVTLASNQSALLVSAAALPLPTGAATEATLSTIDIAIGDIDANVAISAINQVATGTLTAVAQTVTLATGELSRGTGVIQLSGSFSATVTFEGTTDGTTWVLMNVTDSVTGGPIIATSSPGLLFVPVAGLQSVRVRCSAYGSGTVTVKISASGGESGFVRLAGITPVSGNVVADQGGSSLDPNNGWDVSISDYASGIGPATVKAASIAAVAADKALVVAISPNNTVPTSISGLVLSPGASGAAAQGPMVQGLVRDSPEAYLDSTIRPLSLTTDGHLRVLTAADSRERQLAEMSMLQQQLAVMHSILVDERASSLQFGLELR